MKILLLDSSKENDSVLEYARQLTEQLSKNQNHQIISFILRDLDIKLCSGCFNCWFKSPGICVKADTGAEIIQTAAKSDLWIFLTPVTYGGYSYHLKKIIDRMPPLMLPFFIKENGETHHNLRYNKAKLIVFGSLPAKDEESENIFVDLAYRNSINFGNKSVISKVLLNNYDEDTLREIVSDTLSETEVLNEYKKESSSFSR